MITFMIENCCYGQCDPYYNTTLIHEICHSWSGNLVSIKNWNCLFLDEGLTDYLKIKFKYFITNDLQSYLGELEYVEKFSNLEVNEDRFNAL